MFFITPRCTGSDDQSSGPSDGARCDNGHKRKRPSQEDDQDDSHEEDSVAFNRKRIARACDRCRLKKTRCSGGSICSRCKQDRVVCVTTSTSSKKGDIHRHPEYTHLVETQRDQLARALYQILQTRDSAELHNVKSLLTEMGITTESIRLPEQLKSDADHNSGEDLDSDLVTTPTTHQLWDDMFNDLSTSQIEVIESYCATTPQFQSLLMTQPPLELPDDEDFGYDSTQASDSQLPLPALAETSVQIGSKAFLQPSHLCSNIGNSATSSLLRTPHSVVDPKLLMKA